jgi:hypothetical protein
VVAANGRLFILAPDGELNPFARGTDGYATALGPEPYIALAESDSVVGSSCSFGKDSIFAIEPGASPGIILIDALGRAQRFVNLPKAAFLDGISFDGVGRFGHRLLVTALVHGRTTVFAIDCNGAISTISAQAPVVEGGVVVAPASFGRFPGDLIAPDEKSGRIFAIEPSGKTITLARSHLLSGSDIGVESAGFVPSGFDQGYVAYLADRFSRGNAHPGTNSILRLTGLELVHAGVRAGDLLVASEGGAETIVVRCGASCTVKRIAKGPAATHGEGHIVFSTSSS